LSIFVDADKVRLTQCIANLLTNAAKFTPTAGSISVNAYIEDKQAVVEVSDTGAGIAADLLPNVFDLFVQGERSLDRSEGGLGIGLAVCKQLIEMHGGQVYGTSDGVGRGSTFAIRLPLAKGIPESRETSLAVTNCKRRILVVDDNKDAADSLVTLLEIEGHQVKCVYTAEAALEEVELLKPDLILLDIGLPRISGYEVAQRIKAAHPLISVVALSGYGSLEDRQRVIAAGFDAHLLKPVDFDDLKGLISEQQS
jgi:CheY-like chemotaxis protein